MREARIISASTQQTGEPVAISVHDALERTLAERFGGFTVWIGRGGFVMASGELKTELVRVYDVAMEVHHFPALCGIAQWLAREANQECVYVRDPQGHVSFYNRGLQPDDSGMASSIRDLPTATARRINDAHRTQYATDTGDWR